MQRCTEMFAVPASIGSQAAPPAPQSGHVPLVNPRRNTNLRRPLLRLLVSALFCWQILVGAAGFEPATY